MVGDNSPIEMPTTNTTKKPNKTNRFENDEQCLAKEKSQNFTDQEGEQNRENNVESEKFPYNFRPKTKKL